VASNRARAMVVSQASAPSYQTAKIDTCLRQSHWASRRWLAQRQGNGRHNIAASDERRSGSPANRPIRRQLDVKC
jgi:hypothetical protein